MSIEQSHLEDDNQNHNAFLIGTFTTLLPFTRQQLWNASRPFHANFKEQALEFNNSGHVEYMKVNFDDALRDYTKAITLDPGLAIAYYNRGTIHYRLGALTQAIEDLEKAVELEPANQEFREALSDGLKMERAKNPKQ